MPRAAAAAILNQATAANLRPTRRRLAPWPSLVRSRQAGTIVEEANVTVDLILRTALKTRRRAPFTVQRFPSPLDTVPCILRSMSLTHVHQCGVWCSSSPRRVHPIDLFVVSSFIRSSPCVSSYMCVSVMLLSVCRNVAAHRKSLRGAVRTTSTTLLTAIPRRAPVCGLPSFSEHANLNSIVPSDISSFVPAYSKV